MPPAGQRAECSWFSGWCGVSCFSWWLEGRWTPDNRLRHLMANFIRILSAMWNLISFIALTSFRLELICTLILTSDPKSLHFFNHVTVHTHSIFIIRHFSYNSGIKCFTEMKQKRGMPSHPPIVNIHIQTQACIYNHWFGRMKMVYSTEEPSAPWSFLIVSPTTQTSHTADVYCITGQNRNDKDLVPGIERMAESGTLWFYYQLVYET